MGWVLFRVAQRTAIIAQGHMVSEQNKDQKTGGWILDSIPLQSNWKKQLLSWALSARCYAYRLTDTLSSNLKNQLIVTAKTCMSLMQTLLSAFCILIYVTL